MSTVDDSSDAFPLVLVSGVSGYIGSWVAYCALKLGYRVRGTVRSLANESKIAHLRNLCPCSRFKIELVEADLNSEEGWSDAVAGCTYVLHVASPFPTASPAHKDELIRPAVEGTLYLLRACHAASPRPKRVVITSSFAAIGYGKLSSAERPFTEENWTVADSEEYPIDAYTESKTRAERAAWEFISSLPEDERIEIATVNPTLVQGPMLSSNGCSSAHIPRQILMDELPALADMDIFVTHVYDVAKVHLAAMTHPEAAGKRFLCHSSVFTFPEYAGVLKQEFKPRGYSPTSFVAPKWMVGLLSYVDAQAKTIYPVVGKRIFIEPQNVKKILGITLRTDGAEIVREMAYAAIANGIIPDKTRGREISIYYTRPDFDVSDMQSAQPLST